jgi:hypothetical protein
VSWPTVESEAVASCSGLGRGSSTSRWSRRMTRRSRLPLNWPKATADARSIGPHTARSAAAAGAGGIGKTRDGIRGTPYCQTDRPAATVRRVHATVTMPEFATLWTLHRADRTVSAQMCDIQGLGLELRYICDGKLFASTRLEDGVDLLREAHIWRFGLEARGWTDRQASVGGSADPKPGPAFYV